MNLDKIKNFFHNLSSHDLPAGGAILIGIVLLLLMFRVGKPFMRLSLFIIAVALFGGAYWWHTHR